MIPLFHQWDDIVNCGHFFGRGTEKQRRSKSYRRKMNDLERAQFTRTNFCYRVPSVFAAGADDLENLSAGQYCELDIWSDGRETSISSTV